MKNTGTDMIGPNTYAFIVHLITASGALWAFAATLAAAEGRWTEMFWWLGLALFVDAIDGPLARKYDIKRRLPRWSGDSLDFVIDYVTYVFIPAFALMRSGLLPESLGMFCAAIITITGALYFADRGMKMEDNCFRGFPAAWNAVLFCVFVFKPSAELIVLAVVAFGVLTFAPVKFIHPVRVVLFRPSTLTITTLWSIFGAVSLYHDLSPPVPIVLGLAVCSFYMFAIGFVVQMTERFRDRHSNRHLM